MLRFFSRRKVKGRADQKISGRKNSGKFNKNALPCNIMLLDGSDLPLEIGVSIYIFFENIIPVGALVEGTPRYCNI